MRKAIFFDRDGVINEVLYTQGQHRPPWKIKEIKIKKGFLSLKESLQKDFLIFYISNQPDFKRGHVGLEDLQKVNNNIYNKIKPDDFLVDFTDDVRFKKPSPFMVIELIEKYNIEASKSWFIGDRWSDIVAGKKAGCKTILLKTEYSFDKNFNSDFISINPDYTVKSLKDVKSVIL
jgi:D-glycero-D-manno-heptose 1,7-bisphosphate phosphatase